jgi:DNA-binding response OmpR family regulator
VVVPPEQRPEDMRAFVRGLEAALQTLAANPALGVSVRRLARSLAHAADASGSTDVAARARRLQEAGDADLERAGRDLLTYVEMAATPRVERDLEVLLVEDDLTVATHVHSILKREARRVHVAASAAEAEALLASHSVDVVVLDLILPDGDGRDLLIRIRQDPATADIPVIVLSGESGEVAKAECLAVGASEFLSKPADPRALRGAVARHSLRRRQVGSTQAEPRAHVRPVSSPTPTRVLLVEDDRVTSTLISHRLERDGLEVVAFANGEDAFRWAEASTFDLAILDVKVPGMDGFEVLARLRKIPALAGVPVVMLTGLGGEDDVVRGLELGANDYMVKPFSPTELLARVRRLVREPDARRLPSEAGAR